MDATWNGLLSACPLHTRKQTCAAHRLMSAMGQKRTCAPKQKDYLEGGLSENQTIISINQQQMTIIRGRCAAALWTSKTIYFVSDKFGGDGTDDLRSGAKRNAAAQTRAAAATSNRNDMAQTPAVALSAGSCGPHLGWVCLTASARPLSAQRLKATSASRAPKANGDSCSSYRSKLHRAVTFDLRFLIRCIV
jgi:hypothetical protein